MNKFKSSKPRYRGSETSQRENQMKNYFVECQITKKRTLSVVPNDFL